MTKRKSIIATYILAFALCLTLVLGVSLGATTLVAHAEESKNMPQIVSVADKNNKVTEVKEGMVNMPVGMVGEEYYVKIVAANTYDTVSVKPYAEGARGCLPEGLTFNAETNVISGKPKKAGFYDVQIYCRNKNGSTNVLGWLNVYSADQKPTVTGELSGTAHVGSMYYASVAVGGYNQSFTVTLEGNYPQGMIAYRSGVYAYIQFTPTAAMAGKPYKFTLSVNNGLGEVKKECTITVAAGYVPPEIISKRQPLGYSEDNPNGKRALVGKPYEFWLQAIGTSTEENPLTFFAYDETTKEKATPNEKDEYDLGNGLFLRKDGLIYSDCVLEYEGQGNGSNRQKEFHIGVSNINAYDNKQDSGYSSGYCFLNIVKGYMIDSFTISPQSTDIPRGGQRQFTANIKGLGEFDKTVTWILYGSRTDNNTRIDSNGLLTIGANETSTDLWVQANVKNIYAQTESINIIDHIHSTYLVEAATKTCTTDGNIEYFKCDSCDGTFSDAEAINVLTEEQITLKAGHEYGSLIAKVPSTCSATGMEEHFECSACHKLFDSAKAEKTAEELALAIDDTAHKFGEWIAEVPATKEATGTKAHKDCEFCGKHFDNDGNEIEDLTIAKLPSGGEQEGGETPGGGEDNPGGGEDNPGGNDNPGGEVIEPKDEGLSGGAIAGIACGSVAVVGIGGFAIFWFAVKKKSFADLIAAIKGIFKKK